MGVIYNYETLSYAAETLGSFKKAFEKYGITTEEAKANFKDGGVIARAIQLLAEDNFCNYEHIAQTTFDSSLNLNELWKSFEAIESFYYKREANNSYADYEEEIQDKIYNYQVREMVKRNVEGTRKRRTAVRAITRR